ncbi:MAG: prepilin-type N-terminal cleavage/methylation domain-containing protein [Lachnospiraceae bacterium]
MKEKMRKRLKDAKGFTLVEMIVVLAIIAILIALIAPNVAKLIGNAQSTSDAAKTKTIMTSAQTYATEAVAAGYALNTGATGIKKIENAGATTGYMFSLTANGADTTMRKVFNNGAATNGDYNKDFMTTTGDSYLPSNTLQGTDSAYVYYSVNGAVMAVIYCGGTNSDEIKGVSGTAPTGVTDKNFDNSLVGEKIDSGTGKLK